MITHRGMLSALALLVAGAGPALAIEASYECSEGTRLTAEFSPPGVAPGSVVLTISGTAAKVTLPQVMSADGGRYADERIEFWIKGRGATLTRGGNSESCKSK